MCDASVCDATMHGSHGLSGRRARRTKSRRPEGPQTRSWGPEAPKLLVHYISTDGLISHTSASSKLLTAGATARLLANIIFLRTDSFFIWEQNYFSLIS